MGQVRHLKERKTTKGSGLRKKPKQVHIQIHPPPPFQNKIWHIFNQIPNSFVYIGNGHGAQLSLG